MLRVLTAIAAAIPGLASGVAAAAEPWSPPASVGGPADGTPSVRIASGGAGAVIWSRGTATAGASIHGAGLPAGGGVTPAVRLVRGRAAASIATLGASELFLGLLRGSDTVGYALTAMPLLEAPRTTRVRATRATVSRLVPVTGDPAMRLALAWEECRGTRCRLLVRVGGRTTPVHRGRRLGDWSVRAAPGGRMLAAWTERGGLHVRAGTAGGSWGRVKRLGDSGSQPRLSVIFSGRRAGILWGSQRVSENGLAQSPFVVRLATAGGDGRFGRAQVLERVAAIGEDGVVPAPGIALLDDGAGLVAVWTGLRDGRFVPRLQRPGSSAKTLAGDVTGALQAATHAAGRFAIVWEGGAGGTARLMAVTGGAGTAVGTPEAVADLPVAADGASVAVDPRDGRVVVAWRDPVSGDVQISTRPAP